MEYVEIANIDSDEYENATVKGGMPLLSPMGQSVMQPAERKKKTCACIYRISMKTHQTVNIINTAWKTWHNEKRLKYGIKIIQ